MTHTDAAAVALARDGDSEAFRALVERHSRAVFRLAHRMTGNPSDAEDVVQETLEGHRQVSRFESRPTSAPGSTGRRELLHRPDPRQATSEAGHDAADLEQFGAAETAEPGLPSPERLMLSAEVQGRISDAMTALSKMERAAFVLRHFEGQSIDEISRALGLKTNATKHSIFRAVKKMRQALEPFVAQPESESLTADGARS